MKNDSGTLYGLEMLYIVVTNNECVSNCLPPSVGEAEQHGVGGFSILKWQYEIAHVDGSVQKYGILAHRLDRQGLLQVQLFFRICILESASHYHNTVKWAFYL